MPEIVVCEWWIVLEYPQSAYQATGQAGFLLEKWVCDAVTRI